MAMPAKTCSTACLAEHGGFYAQSSRPCALSSELEQRYPEFPGLNLTIEVLEGQATRMRQDTRRRRRPLLEVQVVEAADSVAYDTHDADDALELGLLTLDELAETAAVARGRRAACADAFRRSTRAELKRAVLARIDRLASRRPARAGREPHRQNGQIDSVVAVRRRRWSSSPAPSWPSKKSSWSSSSPSACTVIRNCSAVRRAAQEMLAAMFAGYLARPELLPPGYRARAAQVGWPRSVADYLAGMTDRYAQQEYDRLFARS